MPRLRSNAKSGTILDDPLTASAVTINSAEFAALPVIAAPDTLALVLDPREEAGEAEIVWVTAHASGATSVTVLRGQEQATGGIAGRQHNVGTRWSHGATAADFLHEVAPYPEYQGPPASGTWLRGQRYQDGHGVLWTCIEGGTPGFWNCASPGHLIVRQEAQHRVEATANSIATGQEVGMTITPKLDGTTPIELEVEASLAVQTAGAGIMAILSVCDVSPGNTAPSLANEVLRITSARIETEMTPSAKKRTITPPAGIRTYRALLWLQGAGGHAIYNGFASAGGASIGFLVAKWA